MCTRVVLVHTPQRAVAFVHEAPKCAIVFSSESHHCILRALDFGDHVPGTSVLHPGRVQQILVCCTCAQATPAEQIMQRSAHNHVSFGPGLLSWVAWYCSSNSEVGGEGGGGGGGGVAWERSV